MVKMYSSLFVIVSLLASGIQSHSYSYSVLNNVTVSRDFLQELLLKQIDDAIVPRSELNEGKCLISLKAIINNLSNQEVAPFLDAWGKYPSGVLYKNNYDIGNFEQCVKISVAITEETGVVNGQFCFAKIPLKPRPTTREEYDTTVRDINIGICVPDTCSPEYLINLIQNSNNNDELKGALEGMIIDQCSDGKIPPFTTMNIVALTIFGIVTGLMILSSLYDFVMNYYEKPTVPILLAFSFLTNGKKLFAINTKRSPNNIDCLTAIRVISMIWIMNHHMYSNNFIPLVNQTGFLNWMFSFISMPAYMGTSVVDSFFFIGGLLVAWSGFRDLDKTNGKVNITMNIVHRYIRLTPVLAAGLLVLYGLNNILFTGPFRELALSKTKCDGYNWWPVLLYIQNYFIQDPKCYDETWYLAVDFQLYILSPLLLIPVWKWGKKAAYVVVGLILASMAWVMAVFIMNGYTGMTIGANDGEWGKAYVPMHTRCGPWLVGFLLGYFMHLNRKTTFQISRIAQLLAWIASIGTFIAVVYGPYFSLHANGKGTVIEAALYASLRRVTWSIALAWITFACHYGFGGVVDTLLSHPFWQPFGRLTYSLYLMHMFVMKMHLGMMHTEFYFSPYSLFLGFCSAFIVTFFIAIYMSLAFEAPILILEKFIFGHGEKKPQPEPPASKIITLDPPQKGA